MMGVYNSHVILSCYYRTPVDRDYNKITDCSKVVTHHGGNNFGRLTDVAIAPTGEVIIVDRGNSKVIILNDQLNLLNVIGQGNGNSRLVMPHGVAVTDDVIAVSCSDSHQVKKYSLQGNLLSVIGRHGNRNGQFDYPRGLTFNSNKLLYVVDGKNFRVQVFKINDTFAFSFGSRHFKCPVRISIDPKNNVLVTDSDANGIHIFTHDGHFIQTIINNKPWAITISPTGYLITSHDKDDLIIRVWSPTYQMINHIRKNGSKQGELYGITGIAMDFSGTIYVTENNRLQIFSNS